jgi:hypothetical protein
VEVTVDANMFANLMKSVSQMDEIVRGERQPSREFHIDVMGSQSGSITPNAQVRAGRVGTTINVAVQPTSTRRTAE